MNIEINVLGLIKNKLTASQYVMLNLLFENKIDLFVKYVNLYSFARKEVQGLVDQGYILACDPQNPLTCITALECEISVTAKFSLSHLSLMLLMIFFLLDIINQVLGALQRILVSLFVVTFRLSRGRSKSPILIVLG